MSLLPLCLYLSLSLSLSLIDERIGEGAARPARITVIKPQTAPRAIDLPFRAKMLFGQEECCMLLLLSCLAAVVVVAVVVGDVAVVVAYVAVVFLYVVAAFGLLAAPLSLTLFKLFFAFWLVKQLLFFLLG